MPDVDAPASPVPHPPWVWVVASSAFVLEVVAWSAYGVWGWQAEPGWLWVWLLPVVVVIVWGACAAPRAQYGSPRVRVVVKVLVFGGAVLALADAGHPVPALLLLLAAVVIPFLVRWTGADRVVADSRRGRG